MARAAGSKFVSVLCALLLLLECAGAARGGEYGARTAGAGAGTGARGGGDGGAGEQRRGTLQNAHGVREPSRGVAPSPPPRCALPFFCLGGLGDRYRLPGLKRDEKKRLGLKSYAGRWGRRVAGDIFVEKFF